MGFIVDLPNRQSFCPDAAWYVGEMTMKFLEGPPVLAVEVRSEGDYGPAAEEAMALKRIDYFDAGSQVVWDVDLMGLHTVRVYTAENREDPRVYSQGDEAEAEPAIPGWRMSVDALF